MERGWTKRWRKRWDKGFHKDHVLWMLMDYFIDFSAYNPKDIYVKGHGMVHLDRGECAFTQQELADFFNVGRQRIRTALAFLKNNDFLTQTVTSKGPNRITKIKVIKYDAYQDTETTKQPADNPLSNQPATHKQPERPFVPSSTKKLRNKEEVHYCPLFESFWSEYPKRVKKLDTYAEWVKINPTNGTVEKIMDGLRRYKESQQWSEDGGKYIPDPERFLKKRRWEDEIKKHRGGVQEWIDKHSAN